MTERRARDAEWQDRRREMGVAMTEEELDAAQAEASLPGYRGSRLGGYTLRLVAEVRGYRAAFESVKRDRDAWRDEALSTGPLAPRTDDTPTSANG